MYVFPCALPKTTGLWFLKRAIKRCLPRLFSTRISVMPKGLREQIFLPTGMVTEKIRNPRTGRVINIFSRNGVSRTFTNLVRNNEVEVPDIGLLFNTETNRWVRESNANNRRFQGFRIENRRLIDENREAREAAQSITSSVVGSAANDEEDQAAQEIARNAIQSAMSLEGPKILGSSMPSETNEQAIDALVSQMDPNSTIDLQVRSLSVDSTISMRFQNVESARNWHMSMIDVGQQRRSEVQADDGDIVDISDFSSVFEVSVNNVQLSGGCNSHQETRVKGNTQLLSFKKVNCGAKPGRNNCGISCVSRVLGTKIDPCKARRFLGLDSGQMLDVHHVQKLYESYKQHDKQLVVLHGQEDSFDPDTASDDSDYILLENGHYYVCEQVVRRFEENKANQARGLCAFDFETRESEGVVASDGKTYHPLKPTIVSAVYRPDGRKVENPQERSITFTSTEQKSCARMFLDWLKQESAKGRHYNVIAHNGSAFDFYILLGCMTQKEVAMFQQDMFTKGKRIGEVYIWDHRLKCSVMFVSKTLDAFAKDFGAPVHKASTVTVNGRTFTDHDLKFYRMDLGQEQLIKLHDEEFWDAYRRYCEDDCWSLFYAWDIFCKQVKEVIDTTMKQSGFSGKARERVRNKCDVNNNRTIGGLGKKVCENTFDQSAVHKAAQFMSTSDTAKSYKKIPYTSMAAPKNEKTRFIRKFVRGGISHCHKPGIHKETVHGGDLVSQYPWTLANGTVPAGRSDWFYEYHPKKHGYYQMHHISFASWCELMLTPENDANGNLRWDGNRCKDAHIDSNLLAYGLQTGRITDFCVKKALLSDDCVHMSEIFGVFVNGFFKRKQEIDQDKKDAKKLVNCFSCGKHLTEQEKSSCAGCDTPFWNNAMREVVKLFLNSLSGKCVELPSRYMRDVCIQQMRKDDLEELWSLLGREDFRLRTRDEMEKTMEKSFNWYTLKNNKVFRIPNDSENPLLTCGVSVYSYSKMLLYEFIESLPQKDSSVIAIETDGVYFSGSKDHVVQNMNGRQTIIPSTQNIFPVSEGKHLGGIEFEVESTETSVFLFKKGYMIPVGDKEKMVMKGMPQSYVENDGSIQQMVTPELYWTIAKNGSSTRCIRSLKKHMSQTPIGSFVLMPERRTVTLNGRYNEYPIYHA